MEIDVIQTGYLEENCYILRKDDKCLIVDPGDNLDKILSKIGDLEVLSILVTHHHFDHVGALKELKQMKSVPVIDFYSVKEGKYVIEPFSFTVLFNPGHSKDSISFYFEEDKKMFVGDFVFNGTVGRCDLEGGNFSEMTESIKKLKKYADDIILYPGHGESTTVGNEKRFNPYFK